MGVDGNGDGDTSDDDLTSEQKEAFSEDFSAFIMNNNERDIGSDGKFIDDRSGLLGAEDESSLRTATQFVGAALKDAGYGGPWSNVQRIAIVSKGVNQGVKAPRFVSAAQETYRGKSYFGMDYMVWPSTTAINGVSNVYVSPSNLARIMLHEFGHSAWILGYSRTERRHQAVDSWARTQLGAGGLGGGGCVATNGFPRC